LAITHNDTTGTNIYAHPFKGFLVALYNTTSNEWEEFEVTSILSESVSSLSSGAIFDIFLRYDSSIEIWFNEWSSNTARGTGNGLDLQDGVLVAESDYNARYVCSAKRDSASGHVQDTQAIRHLINYYNPFWRDFEVLETANSWTYSGTAWQAYNSSNFNRVEFLCPFDWTFVEVDALGLGGVNGSSDARVGLGLNSITTNHAQRFGPHRDANRGTIFALYRGRPGISGVHYIQMLESTSGLSTTFYGDQGGSNMQAGLGGGLMG